jgi:hypothetical protein
MLTLMAHSTRPNDSNSPTDYPWTWYSPLWRSTMISTTRSCRPRCRIVSYRSSWSIGGLSKRKKMMRGLKVGTRRRDRVSQIKWSANDTTCEQRTVGDAVLYSLSCRTRRRRWNCCRDVSRSSRNCWKRWHRGSSRTWHISNRWYQHRII